MKDKKAYCVVALMSFILPIIIFIIVMALLNIYPFGDNSLLIDDSLEQYIPFHMALKNIFNDSDNSIFFNWSVTMGGNFFGTFAYYVSSPLAFLTLLCSNGNMQIGLTCLVLLKIGLAGLTFCIFIKSHITEENKLWLALPFSISYALMTYNMIYGTSNLMWLEGIILLPIIMLGVENIVIKNKGTLYIISLVALFYSNFYMGYIIGIFSFIYFIVVLILNVADKNEVFGKIKRYVICSVCSIGLASVILIPAFLDISKGRLKETLHYDRFFATSIKEILKGLLTSDGVTHTGELLPAYCGILIPIFVVAFATSERIKLKEKISYLAIMGMFIISTWIAKINEMWQVFQRPAGYDYRFCFLLSFVMIYMAFIYCNSVKLKRARLFSAVLVCIFAIDLGTNGYSIKAKVNDIYGYSVAEYKDFFNTLENDVNYIKDIDKGFYRVDKTYRYTFNDGVYLNYNAITSFSSVYNLNIIQLLKKLGCAGAGCMQLFDGQTPITSSIFDVKYIMSREMESELYEEISVDDDKTIYRNNYALPIAFGANISRNSDILTDNPFENQNTLLNDLAGTDEAYFYPIDFDVHKDDEQYKVFFKTNENEHVYFYLTLDDKLKTRGGYITVNDDYRFDYFNNFTVKAKYIDKFNNQEVILGLNPDDEWDNFDDSQIFIYGLDVEKYKNVMNKLKENSYIVEKHGKENLVGQVTLKEGQRLFTSIPYDENGWTIKVDGEKVKYTDYNDTFMVIDVPAGTHTVEMKYISPGFKIGVAISSVFLLLTLLYFAKSKKHIHFDNK